MATQNVDADINVTGKVTQSGTPSASGDVVTKGYADTNYGATPPGSKVTDLSVLTGANLATGDIVDLVDISDPTMSAEGTNKQITVTELVTGLRRIAQMPLHAFKTADQSNSSNTTLADVTDLTFPVEANSSYLIEYNLFVVAAATTTGLVVALNGPTIGTGYIRYGTIIPTTATAPFFSGATAYDTALVATATPSITVPSLAIVNGFLATGATAGTLALRMRSEISGSNATIQRGSWGRLVKVA
jgi:hypothetical protein